MQNILSQAKNLGVPDDVLQQVQNINNKWWYQLFNSLI
jgi:hypothetical protein